MPAFEFDIHTHTIASGHGSCATITDMAKAAGNNGLAMLGISDHGPATLGGGRTSYFRSLSHAQRKRLGVDMLYGVEANIINKDGKLDLSDEIMSGLDYVIASMHRKNIKPGTISENTTAYIKAMENPYVRVLGHCDDVNFPVDHLQIVKAAMANHVLIEINNSSLSPNGYRGDTRFNDLMFINLCKYFDYPIVLSSDSHGTKHIGDFEHAMKMCKLAEMPNHLIMNFSASRFREFVSFDKLKEKDNKNIDNKK